MNVSFATYLQMSYDRKRISPDRPKKIESNKLLRPNLMNGVGWQYVYVGFLGWLEEEEKRLTLKANSIHKLSEGRPTFIDLST